MMHGTVQSVDSPWPPAMEFVTDNLPLLLIKKFFTGRNLDNCHNLAMLDERVTSKSWIVRNKYVYSITNIDFKFVSITIHLAIINYTTVKNHSVKEMLIITYRSLWKRILQIAEAGDHGSINHSFCRTALPVSQYLYIKTVLPHLAVTAFRDSPTYII